MYNLIIDGAPEDTYEHFSDMLADAIELRKKHPEAHFQFVEEDAKNKIKWTFWLCAWDHEKHTAYYKPYTTASTRNKWPVPLFEKLAKEGGFTIIHKDRTLIGGYYSNPSNGDCLMCIPVEKLPEEIYPL